MAYYGKRSVELRKYFYRLQDKIGKIRILALNLILSYWLGWLEDSKSHYLDKEPVSAWKRIEEAYNKGRADYK